MPTKPKLELCRFLKIRNHESRFLLPIRKMRNCEPEINSFFNSISDSFGHNSGSNSRKFTKYGQGTRIVIQVGHSCSQNRFSRVTDSDSVPKGEGEGGRSCMFSIRSREEGEEGKRKTRQRERGKDGWREGGLQHCLRLEISFPNRS